MNKLRLTGSLLTRLLGLWLVCASCVQSGYAQQSGGGNYPTGNGVRVKEVDGSPNVPGTQTLVFPNGSLTRAGQTVTVTIAGGTTINSTNGQVPYRVNSTTFGDSAFASNALNSTYLSATSGASGAGLTLAVAGGGGNESIRITPTGTGAVIVPNLGSSTIPGMVNATLGGTIGVAALPGTSFGSASLYGYQNISNATWSAGVVTVTTGATHNYSVGAIVKIVGITPSGYNGTYRIVSAPTATTFTYTLVSDPGSYSAGADYCVLEPELQTRASSAQVPALALAAHPNSVPLSLDPSLPVFLVTGSDSNQGNYSFKVMADGHTVEIWVGGVLKQFSNGSVDQWTGDHILGWTSSSSSLPSTPSNLDLILQRGAAGVLDQRNGTNAQGYRPYGTYTDDSNYVRGNLAASSTAVSLTAETAGTGADNVPINLVPAGTSGVVVTNGLTASGSITGSQLVSTTGALRLANSDGDIGLSGTVIAAPAGSSWGWTDGYISRDAANTLAQKNGNADQLFRSYGANSGYWERGSISESITLSTSGATTDSTADLLPANAIIEAVTARITTTITTATDWALGDATTAARFAAANATLTAGTTSVGLQHVDQTGAAGPKQTSAAKLRITTTGTPGAGVIRVTVYYRKFVPPTS